jgi:hypothetical protein
MEELGRQMDVASRPMNDRGDEMTALGRQMNALSDQMTTAVARANEGMETLVRRAIDNGTAVSVH